MTYHLIVIGCQMNKADSERLAAYLDNLGLTFVADSAQADLIFLVTCGVRQSAENRVYSLVKQIKQDRPTAKVIITGCLSDREDVRACLKNSVDFYFNINDLPQLADKLGLKAAAGSIAGYLSLNAKHGSTASAYVPIGNGCNNFCAYCVVPAARGREVYRPAEEILAEVKSLIDRGYKEITLIAQNVNSYVSPSAAAADFPDLLKTINDLPGDFWLRFVTSHPKDLSDKLIAAVAAGNKICQHWHVAAQSGDDDILRAMNRRYTADHFLQLIKKIRAACPDASLTSDMIVGFPGESDDNFAHTRALMREAGLAQAFIARYSPRPGTAAARLPDNVGSAVKKERAVVLTEILRASARDFNQRFVGKTVKVLVDRWKDNFYYGKNSQFVTVKFPAAAKNLTGQFVQVTIKQAGDFGLTGEIYGDR